MSTSFFAHDARSARADDGASPRRDRVFGPLTDRALHLDRGDRLASIAALRRGLRAFPETRDRDTRPLLRRAMLHDAANRLVFRLQTKFPRAAKAAARFVPISDPHRALAGIPANRPIVLALMHFGPIHLVFTVLMRRLAGRNLIALHAGGEHGEAVARYLRAIGAEPVLNDERGLRTVARAMANDPRCVVVVSFDYLAAGGRATVPFLGTHVAVARGLAYLADAYDAVVVPACASWYGGPHVQVFERTEVDRELGSHDRREALTRRLFGILEAKVRSAPHAWTEWRNAHPAGAGAARTSV